MVLSDDGKTSRYIDISTPLVEGIVVYTGDPSFEIQACSSISKEGFRGSVLRMGTHCGTHVDAPSHVIANGSAMDEVSFEVLCGKARVLDLRDVEGSIDTESIRALVANCERVLLKTSSGPLVGRPMNPNWVHLSVDAARFLRNETSVKLVGITTCRWRGRRAKCLRFIISCYLGETRW